MEVKQNVNIHNRFDIEVRNIETNKTKKYTAYNIVLNQMWERLCGGNSYFSNIHFGTGNGIPVASDTSLFAHLGTKTAVDEELVKAIPISRWKRKIVLNPEEYVGSNITEVGIAFGSSNANLVTHAMLKDSEGNIISITKTSTDVVTIYATVFVTFDITNEDLIWEANPNNTLVNYLIGGASAPTGNFGLSSILSASQRLGSSPTVNWIADVANKKRKTNIVRFDINTANGHCQCLDFTTIFQLKIPSIGIFLGQSYSNVSLGVGDGSNNIFSIPSQNIKNNSLIIKNNGVETINYILETNKRFYDKNNIPSNGKSVAMSLDGMVLACTMNYPYIKVYDYKYPNWIERPNFPTIQLTDPSSVALNSDGSVVALSGFRMSPYVEIYDWNGTTWIERPTPPNLVYGYSVALNADGSVLAVAGYDMSPYVKCYDWNGTTWIERPTPYARADSRTVCLSANGNTLLIASYGKDCFIYDWNGTTWIERPKPSLNSTWVYDASLNADGSVLAVTHYDKTPCVVVYDWNGTTWVARPTPPIPTGSNAYCARINSDGTILLFGCAGASNAKYYTIYNWVNSNWVAGSDIPNSFSGPSSGALNDEGSILAFTYINKIKAYTNKEATETYIKFNTPPEVGKVITADYTVDGIHKTDQYVVDVSFAIQFGEGV